MCVSTDPGNALPDVFQALPLSLSFGMIGIPAILHHDLMPAVLVTLPFEPYAAAVSMLDGIGQTFLQDEQQIPFLHQGQCNGCHVVETAEAIRDIQRLQGFLCDALEPIPKLLRIVGLGIQAPQSVLKGKDSLSGLVPEGDELPFTLLRIPAHEVDLHV